MNSRVSNEFLIVEKRLKSLIGATQRENVRAFKYLCSVSGLSKNEAWSVITSWKDSLPNWVNEYVDNALVSRKEKKYSEKKFARQIVKPSKVEDSGFKRMVYDSRHGKVIDNSKHTSKPKKITKGETIKVKSSDNIERYKKGHNEEKAVKVLVDKDKQIIKDYWGL